jgi:hypothetical protein
MPNHYAPRNRLRPVPGKSRIGPVFDHATYRDLMVSADSVYLFERLFGDTLLTVPRRHLPLTHQFTRYAEEPEPQASGRRTGPPRKFTATGVSGPPLFPEMNCFACGQTMVDISAHVESCADVSPNDLARFREAQRGFQLNPARAFEMIRAWLARRGRTNDLGR